MKITFQPSSQAANNNASLWRARWRLGRKLLMTDEPTGNLDGETGKQVMDLIFALRERTGATLMLITHDEKLARRCGRVLHMNDGRIIGRLAPKRRSAPARKVEA